MSMLDYSTIQWRKSSHSGAQGDDCVEIGAVPWRKSSRSSGQGGECVEVAELTGLIAVRDSKDPAGPVLSLNSAAFGALLGRIRHDH
jgi:hypothetical protein